MDAVPISADASERERNATVAPHLAVVAGKPLTLGSFVLFAVAIVAVTFAAYSNSFTGTALFHHVPNSVEDPVLDNTMLHSRLLFPKIFTGEFMLATRTEYRPLGYALQALVSLQLPQGSVMPWHVALILLHAAAAFLVFLTMRRLVANIAAFAFAAAYAAHPLFAPLVNDVNEMYFLWGLLFTAGSILLYVLYLKSAKFAVLVASGVMFAAAAFSFRYAFVVPAIMTGLWLFHDTRPRLAAASVVVLPLVTLCLCLYRTPVWAALGAPFALTLIVAAFTARGKLGYPRLFATLMPAVAGGAAWFAVRALVETPSIFILGEPKMTFPSEMWFVTLANLASSRPLAACAAMAALLPLVLLLRGNLRYASLAFAVAFFGLTTFSWNRLYADDVRYWSAFDVRRPGIPAIELHLASAYVDAGRFEEARDRLLYLRYESAAAGGIDMAKGGGMREIARTGEYDALSRDLLQAAVLHELGRAYQGLGNVKVAGFFMYPRNLGANSRLRKPRLMVIGDFCLATGYISWAENHYASCQIMDPYDVRVYNGLGRCMLYKNNFRAAARHFEHVLKTDPSNVAASYHLAFIAKMSGDEGVARMWGDRYRRNAGVSGEIDFTPVYDAFRFDKESMRRSFTGDPTEVMRLLADREAYVVEFKGNKYEFSEAALEIGRYFVRRSDFAKAQGFLQQAVDANPRYTDALREAIANSKQLNRAEDAARFERMLEAAGR